MELDIKTKIVCESCLGKGFIIRSPSPLTVNSNIYETIKNNNITAEQIDEILNTPPQNIKGVTDVELHIICVFCNGAGFVEKRISLDELKTLLNA